MELLLLLCPRSRLQRHTSLFYTPPFPLLSYDIQSNAHFFSKLTTLDQHRLAVGIPTLPRHLRHLCLVLAKSVSRHQRTCLRTLCSQPCRNDLRWKESCLLCYKLRRLILQYPLLMMLLSKHITRTYAFSETMLELAHDAPTVFDSKCSIGRTSDINAFTNVTNCGPLLSKAP